MTLHFVHIGKTGGTAVKVALWRAGLAYWHEHEIERVPETPYGKIRLHHHRFRLSDVPPGDHACFCIRDPIARFFSGYYSRLNKGQPRFYYEWSNAERAAFEEFPSPQRLAAALHSADDGERARAEAAMGKIRHLGSMARYLGTPRDVRRRLGQIAYIATQETLSGDWERLKWLLGLPPDVELPEGRQRAHTGDPTLDTSLDDAGARALREWYVRDYKLVRYCEQVRILRGWSGEREPSAGVRRLRREARRLRAYSAVTLPPPATLHLARRFR